MHYVLMGLLLLLPAHAVWAAPAVSLVQAAGFMPLPQPKPAADFALQDLEGRTRHLHELHGKVIFLNFWATWCPPCRQEMPAIDRLYQSLRQRPFVVWAVDMQESREQVASYIEQDGLHFAVLLDVDGHVSSLYGVRGLPTTYLIDCSGSLVGQALGPRQWDRDEVRTLLAALLNDTRCQ
jgi:peroxiredoxin